MPHHHEFWWRFFPHKELRQVYLSAGLRSFAVSLLGIFIPLYLHTELGLGLQQTLLFFLLYSAFFAISTPLAAKLASRYGIKHSVLLAVPLYLAFVALLYALPHPKIPLSLLAALLGLSQGFYWMGMNLVFHHASHRSHRGEEVGKRGSVMILGSVAGPFAGGVLITFAGFPAVFAAASLVLLLSAGVLFRSRESYLQYHFSLRGVLNRGHWRDSLFFVSRGTRVIAEGVLWPLFIFIILGSYIALGLAGSLLAGVSAGLLWLVGKYSDHAGKRRIARWATLLDSLAWAARAFVATPLQVFAVTIFAAITHGIRESPLGALEFDKAGGQVAEYFVSREIFICLGRILLLGLILLSMNLAGGFLLHAVANLAAWMF